MLTQARVRELLHYDEKTGVFTWKVKKGGRAVAGQRAGARDHYGYIVIRLDGVLYKAHRLAWLYESGSWPVKNLDHINRDKSDNRLKNLRLAGQSLNMHNAKRTPTKSGVVGVVWDSCRKKWVARVKINYATVFLGRFDKKEDAIKARKSAHKKIMAVLETPHDTL